MNNNVLHSPRSRDPRGFTLIEVLVALVILAIGLLGLASLQARGLKFNHDAYVRSQSTLLAYDIVDRMRANRDNLDDYAGTPATTCTATDAGAANEVKCWQDDLAASLPGGTGTITALTGANAGLYTIAVTWADRETGGTRTQSWTILP